MQPAEAPLSEQLAGLEERGEEEEIWGQALFHVSEGLTAGRRWLWDEASRKISVLLASPAAFAGEHFLQACACPPSSCPHVSAQETTGQYASCTGLINSSENCHQSWMVKGAEEATTFG